MTELLLQHKTGIVHLFCTHHTSCQIITVVHPDLSSNDGALI